MKADSVHFILIMIVSFYIKGYNVCAAKTWETLLLSKLNTNLTQDVLFVYDIILYYNEIYMNHNAVTDAKCVHTRIL